jgi:hypothetical protein
VPQAQPPETGVSFIGKYQRLRDLRTFRFS